MKMNTLLAIFAFLVLAAFLSVLVIHVPRLDLTAVIVFTLLLAGWDLYTTHKKKN
jgi:hypothetical protein